jgi:hypothetical protein
LKLMLALCRIGSHLYGFWNCISQRFHEALSF